MSMSNLFQWEFDLSLFHCDYQGSSRIFAGGVRKWSLSECRYPLLTNSAASKMAIYCAVAVHRGSFSRNSGPRPGFIVRYVRGRSSLEPLAHTEFCLGT